MSILPNARHERFAQELAQGKTADEAYQLAGYARSRPHASRLATSGNVRARVAEILSRVAARVEVTVESLLAEAEEVRVKAVADGQFNAAIQAIKEKGVLSGKRIERNETGKPGDFSRMNDAELIEFIASRTGRLGGGLSRIGNETAALGLLPGGRPN